MQLRTLSVCALAALSLALSGCLGGGLGPRVDTRAAAPANTGVKVGKPYTVSGKTYRPAYRTAYSQEGTASWYGPGFHGKKTANGERFNQYAMTAAHPTLHLPCHVRVTNLENERSVVVRVNDRGPFAKGRIIDLSMAAADKLDFKNAGTARVRVELLPEGAQTHAPDTRVHVAQAAPTPAVAAPVPQRPITPATGGVFVQVGAFSVESNARGLAQRLGPSAAVAADAELWRVYMGPYASEAEAETVRQGLAAAGHGRGQIVRNL